MSKNLDDDFDELTNPDHDKSEIKFSLTPKGALLASLMESKTFDKFVDTDNFDIIMNITDEVWMHFENIARNHYGKGEEVAAVIFDSNGGHFHSVMAGPDEEEEDED